MSSFRVKPLVRIQSDDPVLNRIQDQHIDAVNPLLRTLTQCPASVTGSRGGNAALASLITALANLGLIKDGTTA